MTAPGPTPIAPGQGRVLLGEAPALARLPNQVLDELAGALQEEHIPAGTPAVTEGEVGDQLYLIAAGRAEVTLASTNGPVLLAALGPGDLFGEDALLAPDARRTATVTALTPLTLFSLTRASVTRLLATQPAVHAALAAVAEEIQLANFLKQASPFAALDAGRRRQLAARLEARMAPAGTSIMEEGEAGDVCYLVRRGEVAVVRLVDGQERLLATLGPGSLVGEAALLTDAPRTATVRATVDSHLLALHRADLLAVVAQERQVGEQLSEFLTVRARPRQRSGVEAHHRSAPDGQVLTTLKDPRRGAYYRLSPQGWFIWQQLNGEHTLRDLTFAYLQEFKAFAPQAVIAVIAGLASAGFVDQPALRPALRAAAPSGRGRLLLRRPEWYLPLRNVDARLARLYRGGIWLLFTLPVLALMSLVIIAGLTAFALGGPRVAAALAAVRAGGWLLLVLLPATVVSMALHEAGHAFATKHFGREVAAIGVGWYWFGPVAYVDTSDMWLAGRWPRIAVNLAGVVTDLVVAGLAALGAWAVPNVVAAAVLWQFALSCYIPVLLNLNPLLELDGYFVLIDWLERPNLRPRAMAWLGRKLVPTLKQQGVAGLQAHGLEVAYGVGSILYIGVEVWLMVVVYRLLVEGWLARLAPAAVAGGLAGALAALVIALTVAGVLADLRGTRAPVSGH